MKNLFTNLIGVYCSLIMISMLTATNLNAQYCTSAATDIDDAWMTNVNFAGINNDSEAGLYTDFTSISGTVVPGATYTFSTTLSYGAFNYFEKAGLWIDWNQDEIFDASELYKTDSCNTEGCVLTTEVEVPVTAIPGETRMRVQLRYGTNPTFTPCGTFAYDEVEDYTINVESGVCTPPNFTYTVVNDCEGGNYDVTALLSDFGTSNFITINAVRSDAVVVNPIPLVAALEGNVVTIFNNIPLGVTITATIAGSNPICNLTRNFEQLYCHVDGEICDAPIAVSSLPFTTEGTTATYLDDYNFTSATFPPLVPGAITSGSTAPYSYLTGDDVVYSYTPSGVEILNITVSDHGTWPGLFVFTGCPFALTEGYATTTNGIDSLKIHGLTVLPGQTYYIVISTNTAPQSIAYKLNITKLEDCAGAPSAGTIDSEDMMVCAATAITLATEGASEQASGLLLTWQSSPAGANQWTDIVGANSATYVLEEGITVPTDFRFFAECANSDESDISNVLALTINPVITECYCVASNSYSESYYMSNVSTDGALQDLDRSSGFGAGGYADYTATDTLVTNASQQFDFSVSWPSSTYNVGVWVDFNQNGAFEDEEQIILSGFGTSPFEGTIVVPDDLADGSYRMRVRANYIGIPTACGDNNYAEAEDYILKVITLNECAGTPEAGTVTGSSFVICPTNDFSLVVEGSSSPANGLERIWQSSPAGANTWADIAEATSTTYNVEGGISVATDFRYRVTCTNSNQTDYSNVIQASINTNVTDCYCIPVGTNSSYYINNFTTTNGVSNISNLASGFSPGGYGDFTTMTVSQVQTQDVSFSEDFVGGTAGFRIWVDWNQDGAFDIVTELAYNSSSYSSSHSGTFTVPQSALAGPTRMRIVVNYLNSTGLIDPCGSFTYGEFEDYNFDVIPLGSCTGTPSAGVADNDEIFICPTAPITLSVTGASDPATGLIRNWQSSPAGANTWIDIDGATAPTYVVADGVSEATDFRYAVTCVNSNQTVYSNVVETTINTTASECYCVPEGTNSTYYINNFSTTNGIQNITNNGTGFSPNGYGDFTSMIVSQVQTQSVNFTEDFSSGTAGFRIWVDWNQDGAFDVVTELAYNSTSYSATQSGSFTVPQSALAGPTRMRVVAHYLSSTGLIDPCASFTYGEFEDYTLDVIALESCTGTPAAGVASVGQLNVCPSTPITLSVSGASDPATGLVRNWQSSPAGANTWTNIAGAIENTFVLADGISVATDFRYFVNCENSNQTDYSNVLQITINTVITECYCIPEGTTVTRFINNFSTTGAIQNVTNLNSGFSAAGYGDFTSMIVEQATEATVNFSVDITGGTHGFRIWVDWNQDGIFDIANEVAYNSTAYSASHTGSFTVPASAAAGTTRMRIVSHWLSATGLIDPCITGFTYGEFEDYTFNVSSSSATSLNGTVNWNSNCGDRAGTVRLYTPNTATLLQTYPITVAANGTFSISDLPAGSYDVIVKVQGYLAKGIQDVVIAAGANTIAVGTIRNGNVNNDNSINLFDVSLINAGFNKAVGQTGYNPLADLNCDGSINVFDISILNASFNKAGASAPL